MIASKLPTPASYDSAAGTKTQKLKKEREILNIVRLIWSNEEKLVAKEKKKVGCCCMSWGSKEDKLTFQFKESLYEIRDTRAEQ